MARGKAERSEATRRLLTGVARRLFGERGYAGTSIEAVVREAGVTRGALYHHFDGKRDLFRAVFEAVERDLVERVARTASAEGAADPWERLEEGVRTFLRAAIEPQVQRIVLLDAPAVLGWTVWRELDERYGLGLVRRALQAAMDAGLLAPQPVDPLAHLLMAAFNEASMLIARADDVDATLEVMTGTILGLLDRLRAGPRG